MPVKTQIQLDIDENFQVTEARIKELEKDTSFVVMGKDQKSTPDNSDQPTRNNNVGQYPNKRIMLLRTGTGTCTWVKTASTWVWRCT